MGPNARLKIDIGVILTAVITQRSYEELDLAPGREIGVAFKASAIHVVEKNA